MKWDGLLPPEVAQLEFTAVDMASCSMRRVEACVSELYRSDTHLDRFSPERDAIAARRNIDFLLLMVSSPLW